MKEERNFAPYPIYPPYQGMGPMSFGMPNMMPAPNSSCSMNISNDNIDQEINNLQQKVNNLEQRINNLEKTVNGTGNNYNSSNYQML